MSSIVFTLQSDAQSFASAVDAKLGYPRAGVNVGGGIHGPSVTTQRHSDVLQHPTLPQWAFLAYDATAQGVVNASVNPVPVPATGTIVASLDASWVGATVLGASVQVG